MVTVRLFPLPPRAMLAVGTRVGLEELGLIPKLAAGVSVSLTVKGTGPAAVSSLITWSAISETTGAAFTVTVNVRETTLLRVCPSLTLTVMVAAPLVPAAGVKVGEPVELGLA